MKKKFLLISAIVAFSMGVMFVSCNENAPSGGGGGATKGCTCTYQVPGWDSSSTSTYSASKLNELGVSSCSELENWLKRTTDYKSVYCY